MSITLPFKALCLMQHIPLCLGYERRHEHPAISRSISPYRKLLLKLFLCIMAMDYNLLLEWIVKKLEVAVSLKKPRSNPQLIYPPEVLGIQFSDNQPFRVFADVVDDNLKRAVMVKNLIIESGLKNRLQSTGFIYLDFPPGYIVAELLRNISCDKKENVDMVWHDNILQNLYERLNFIEMDYELLNLPSN